MNLSMEEKAKLVTQLLKVLSNENRLLILCALAEQPMTVSEILAVLPDISQPGVSQHLSILRSHKILDSKKTAQTITYSICDPRILKVMKVLKEEYCE